MCPEESKRRARDSRAPSVEGCPLQDIRLARGVCTRINTMIRKHPLCLGTPPHPFIAYTIARYSVSSRPSFITIHAIQYW